MKILKSTGLAVVFMFAADMAFAATTGMTGIHGLLVDGGAAFGESAGIPHLDWNGLMENGEWNWIDPSQNPHAGHNHGGGDAFAQFFNEFGSGTGELGPDLSCEGGHWHGDQWHCQDHGPSLPDGFSGKPEGFGFGTG